MNEGGAAIAIENNNNDNILTSWTENITVLFSLQTEENAGTRVKSKEQSDEYHGIKLDFNI